MIHINSYACASAAGDNTESLWRDLTSPADEMRREFLFHGSRPSTIRQLLCDKLLSCLAQTDIPQSGRIGVILASTKGFSNDFIWERDSEIDPLTPLLEDVLKRAEIKVHKALCVSNACSSGIAALKLAELWLNRDLDHVLILAADALTPFVKKGFDSLKLLTADYPRPFDQSRSGFFLGEGAACLWLSREARSDSLKILWVGLDTEGSPVTRPHSSSESLVRAARPGIEGIDLIMAHGTATPVNDHTEDLAFSALFPHTRPFVTGSKWRTGHTLSASGSIDTILACESLKRGTSFALETTRQLDPQFKGNYLLPKAAPVRASRVMISSLGFGGMQAVAMVGL